MAKSTFGVPSLKKPTPKKWSNAIDIFTAVAGAVSGYVITAEFIPSSVSNIIGSILGFFITIAQVIKPFIGVNVAQEEVPIEQVEVIDDNPKP